MKNSNFKAILFLLVCCILGIYSHWIEPNWIEVSRHSVAANVSRRLKLAHLSDLHIRALGTRELRVHSLLAKENPDAIFITGDTVAENANHEAVAKFLQGVRAPLGVWIVRGNWEHWRPHDTEREIYQKAGIRFLHNSAEKLVEGIWIVGIDDEVGDPDLQKALIGVPENAFKIGLFHSPAFFDRSNNQFHLALAGHTHGGQVRLPFLPPLWLPQGSGRFVSGWYNANRSDLYVSRGLGNSIFDIRFGCRPELPIIEIGP